VPERPTGTVTFLFTDIEGSTRLLQKLRERYDAVQSRHAEILRAAFAEHDGHEIDTQGDAFSPRSDGHATPSLQLPMPNAD
jgi:class 3 adenylate cyclase